MYTVYSVYLLGSLLGTISVAFLAEDRYTFLEIDVSIGPDGTLYIKSCVGKQREEERSSESDRKRERETEREDREGRERERDRGWGRGMLSSF